MTALALAAGLAGERLVLREERVAVLRDREAVQQLVHLEAHPPDALLPAARDGPTK